VQNIKQLSINILFMITKIREVLGFFLALIFIYIIFSYAWSILHMQSCSYDTAKQSTCEQIAENNSKNCKYLILRWKKVDYNDELKRCNSWDTKPGNNLK
jgi:hypothetical protein